MASPTTSSEFKSEWPGQPDTHGADHFGGTRTGKENVEPVKPAKS